MTSPRSETTTSYEIINNFCLSEPIDLKSKLKRNYTVIIYLAILALVSFGALFTFSGLIKRFHSTHCFLDTPFKFTAHQEGDGPAVTEFILSTVSPANDSSSSPSSAVATLLSSVRIDHEDTMWSKHDRCDSVTYPPVIMGMSAIIWMAMFYLCSMTDRNHKSLIPNPWRIVLPAFVYFAFMSMVAIYFTIRSQQSLNGVCASLSSAFVQSGEVPKCPQLMDQFAVASTGHWVAPSVLFFAFYVCMYSVMVLWLLLSGLMLFRCLFGVDFQRTGVEINHITSASKAPTPLIEHKALTGK